MYLIVGVVPVSILIIVALHIMVESPIKRMILIVIGTVVSVVTGMTHFMFIGVILLCIEIIINKITHTNG